MSERFSLDISTHLGINAGAVSTSNNNLEFYFYPQPIFHLEPKWNYNIKKRARLYKRTSRFSSNFLSLHTSYYFKVSNYTYNYLTIGPTWGIQRNFGEYGYFRFKTGLGYRKIFTPINFRYTPVVLLLNLQLGMIF